MTTPIRKFDLSKVKSGIPGLKSSVGTSARIEAQLEALNRKIDVIGKYLPVLAAIVQEGNGFLENLNQSQRKASNSKRPKAPKPNSKRKRGKQC